MANLYKEYYEASQRSDEWAACDLAEISEKIERQREINSWNNYPEDSGMKDDPYQFSGGV